MGVTINKRSTTTEPPPKNGQQPKPPGGLIAFYWYQIFALDSAVVEVQDMFSSHGGHQTLLRGGDQEVYSFLCSPLWEKSDETEIMLTKYLKLKSISLDSLRLV